jgi:hypothetical protein
LISLPPGPFTVLWWLRMAVLGLYLCPNMQAIQGPLNRGWGSDQEGSPGLAGDAPPMQTTATERGTAGLTNTLACVIFWRYPCATFSPTEPGP